MGAAGSDPDLWVSPKTDAGGTLTSVVLADGRNLRHALRSDGPVGLGVQVWFAADREHRGVRLRDMVWDTSVCGVKIVSERLAQVMRELDPTLVEMPVDLRGRRSRPIEGYVVLMEQVGELTAVHSMKRGSRGSAFVVSSEVMQRVRADGFTGLEWSRRETPFPADEPLEQSDWPCP